MILFAVGSLARSQNHREDHMALTIRFPASLSRCLLVVLLTSLATPALSHDDSDSRRSGYYLAIGDSISAGEGALPVTDGFVYRLYEEAVFGSKRKSDFANIAIRAAQTGHVIEHQVPQAICITGFQPNVVTITVGANDLFAAAPNITGELLGLIAIRTADIVNRLLNGSYYPDVTLPGKETNCPGLPKVTVLVANNYTLPHPNPAIRQALDSFAAGYDQLLRLALSSIYVPQGSRIILVDLYRALKGRSGLFLIEKPGGITGPGPFDFDPHPTTAGHAAIARAFERAWEFVD
jgi:lysophospholipase L1-like esterase